MKGTLIFLFLFIIGMPLSYANTVYRDAIPMQRIIYPDSFINQLVYKSPAQTNIPFLYAHTAQLKIENTNVDPEQLKLITNKIRVSICTAIHNGKVRFWVEASGKAGVVVSASLTGGIEITIDCNTKNSKA